LINSPGDNALVVWSWQERKRVAEYRAQGDGPEAVREPLVWDISENQIHVFSHQRRWLIFDRDLKLIEDPKTLPTWLQNIRPIAAWSDGSSGLILSEYGFDHLIYAMHIDDQELKSTGGWLSNADFTDPYWAVIADASLVYGNTFQDQDHYLLSVKRAIDIWAAPNRVPNPPAPDLELYAPLNDFEVKNLHGVRYRAAFELAGKLSDGYAIVLETADVKNWQRIKHQRILDIFDERGVHVRRLPFGDHLITPFVNASKLFVFDAETETLELVETREQLIEAAEALK
jgi:hypothetical protein